mmetsp:Transcript_40502/g.39006  ORF Transcript_40502/g.39006 Transcript_40502/m.39006 type:complete len:88 (+) Transcript_40502:1100-1363(+)
MFKFFTLFVEDMFTFKIESNNVNLTLFWNEIDQNKNCCCYLPDLNLFFDSYLDAYKKEVTLYTTKKKLVKSEENEIKFEMHILKDCD